MDPNSFGHQFQSFFSEDHFFCLISVELKTVGFHPDSTFSHASSELAPYVGGFVEGRAEG